jgi:hypothetical protein
MTPLVYQMDVSSCSPEDADNAMEEFLASGLWPPGQQFGFDVETKESPLSKVIVLMP